MSTSTTIGSSSEAREIRPFLKWVGGKQQLLPQFEPFFPITYSRYFEPFLGGGAVFFHLAKTNRLSKQAYLSDTNEELINVYKVVRDELDALIELLTLHQNSHNREYYYQVRLLDRLNLDLSNVERAARTIYLNRTCYNGLYRVNRKKQFNVPIGSYKNPRILFKNVLESAHTILRDKAIEVRDFRELDAIAEPGDFFYFDPPYDPISKTSSFTGYTSNNFRDEDQMDLAKVFRGLDEKGCFCMLSNSYTPFILSLYQDFRIELVSARRSVNSRANGRGSINEVLILNY